MNISLSSRRLAASALAAGVLTGAALGLAGTATAQPNTNTVTYSAGGVTATVDCGHGGALHLSGSHDDLTVTGTCSALHVSGDANRVAVTDITDCIDLSGNDNTVKVAADFDGSTLEVGGNNDNLNTGTG